LLLAHDDASFEAAPRLNRLREKASANLVLFLPDVKPLATFTASGRLMLGRADRIGRNVLGGKTLTCELFML